MENNLLELLSGKLGNLKLSNSFREYRNRSSFKIGNRSSEALLKLCQSMPAMRKRSEQSENQKEHTNVVEMLWDDDNSFVDEIVEWEEDEEELVLSILEQMQKLNLEMNVILLNTWLVDKSVLEVVGGFIFHYYGHFKSIVSVDDFGLFFRDVEKEYYQHPYHNSEHAADVLYNMHCIIIKTDLKDYLNLDMIYILLLTAILHDVRHPGCSNAYLIRQKHVISLQFEHSDSPMEEMHTKVALEMLRDPKYGLFRKMAKDRKNALLAYVPKLIRATSLQVQKDIIQNVHQAQPELDHVICLAFHAADIGASAKPFLIHCLWAVRIHQEMQKEHCDNNQYHEEQDTQQVLASIAESQSKFLKHMVLPVYSALQNHTDLQTKEYIAHINTNIATWLSLQENASIV